MRAKLIGALRDQCPQVLRPIPLPIQLDLRLHRRHCEEVKDALISKVISMLRKAEKRTILDAMPLKIPQ